MNKCIMKDCENQKYKDKYMCEKHWKGRRKLKNYKQNRRY